MTFTTLAIIAAAASAGTSAVGQVQAGRAAGRAGRAQQQVAESEAALADYNAHIADLQAPDAIERGAEQESRFRTQVRDLVAKQRTGFAAGGIDVNYGSAAAVQADATMLGELDARTIRTNAIREAWGFQVQGEDLRRRAQITRMGGVMAVEEGRQRAAGAYLGAATSLIGAGGDLLLRRYGMSSSANPAIGPHPLDNPAWMNH
jgi:hypothetical protein